MPNHLHAIVLIEGNKIPKERRDCTDVMPQDMKKIANQSGWLSITIGGIKSAVTKYAHEHQIDFAWQSRFHDHIVRNTKEMNLISDYIENNVLRWESDFF